MTGAAAAHVAPVSKRAKRRFFILNVFRFTDTSNEGSRRSPKYAADHSAARRSAPQSADAMSGCERSARTIGYGDEIARSRARVTRRLSMHGGDRRPECI